MHNMRHLFLEGALLHTAGTMTGEAIAILKSVNVIRDQGVRGAGQRGARPEHVAYVWPGDTTEAILLKDMARIQKVTHAYFVQNFPHWEYMNSLAAFDLHCELSMTQRHDLILRVAQQWQVNQQVNGEALWRLGLQLCM